MVLYYKPDNALQNLYLYLRMLNSGSSHKTYKFMRITLEGKQTNTMKNNKIPQSEQFQNPTIK